MLGVEFRMLSLPFHDRLQCMRAQTQYRATAFVAMCVQVDMNDIYCSSCYKSRMLKKFECCGLRSVTSRADHCRTLHRS